MCSTVQTERYAPRTSTPAPLWYADPRTTCRSPSSGSTVQVERCADAGAGSFFSVQLRRRALRMCVRAHGLTCGSRAGSLRTELEEMRREHEAFK